MPLALEGSVTGPKHVARSLIPFATGVPLIMICRWFPLSVITEKCVALKVCRIH
ncbi:hypothetical protein HYDPIDRAFT_109346, partial [Hydnomerulius pinastri MD-312]